MRLAHGSVGSPWALALSLAIAGLVVWGCGEDDGKTPVCPELELYDIRKYPDIPPSAVKARDEAAAAKCVTAPGTATLPGGGGAAGAGGSAGAAGAAGGDGGP